MARPPIDPALKKKRRVFYLTDSQFEIVNRLIETGELCSTHNPSYGATKTSLTAPITQPVRTALPVVPQPRVIAHARCRGKCLRSTECPPGECLGPKK